MRFELFVVLKNPNQCVHGGEPVALFENERPGLLKTIFTEELVKKLRQFGRPPTSLGRW